MHNRACIATIAALAMGGVLAPAARATWSIVMADECTGEVAVGTVTCLNNFDLLAIVPVVVVGEGGAAVQAAGDFNGIRRPVIFDGLRRDIPPARILVELADIGGHQQRQYGIVDTEGEAVTFTGSATIQWAGGVTGADGTIAWAIQGNILAGSCVVPAIEQAVLATPGDMAAKLMAGMQAARQAGGDGRCSCSQGNPTGCGCPPAAFAKSGHIGCMVVARIGDLDDGACNASGCADGDYFMTLNVPFQPGGAADPVAQLQALFDAWRDDLAGRPDAVQSIVTFDPPVVPANGVSGTTMHVTLLDWQGRPIDVEIETVQVTHGAGSAGLSVIGSPADEGGGVFAVPLTAGTGPGVDRFTIVVDDGASSVTLMPEPALEYFALGDVNGDGVIDVDDLVAVILSWGPCSGCPADLNGDTIVGVEDLVAVVLAWG